MKPKSAEDQASEYARMHGPYDRSIGNHVNTRAESWMSGHSAGMRDALELADCLTEIHDQILTTIREGKSCFGCALTMVKIGKAVDEFKRAKGES